MLTLDPVKKKKLIRIQPPENPRAGSSQKKSMDLTDFVCLALYLNQPYPNAAIEKNCCRITEMTLTNICLGSWRICPTSWEPGSWHQHGKIYQHSRILDRQIRSRKTQFEVPKKLVLMAYLEGFAWSTLPDAPTASERRGSEDSAGHSHWSAWCILFN